MTSPLHVALIAVACSPSQGSELGLGWKAVAAISELHRLTVFVHSNHRVEIEDHLKSDRKEPSMANVDFVYVAEQHEHHRNQSIARLMTWHYYRLWLRQCVDAVKDHHTRTPFDLVHHVTYSTWRMGSPFYETGIPTVWGPVGGAGKVPFSAYSMLSRSAKITESLRTIISKIYSLSPAFHDSLNKNDVVLASNEETKRFMETRSSRRFPIVFPTYFEASEQGCDNPDVSETPHLNCFYGGGIIGSKGIVLSFGAISLARKRGVDVIFRIAGPGPEVAHLQNVAKELGIEDRVEFLPLLTGTDYTDILKGSDLFLFPSFRENIGITMVDAMLHNTAPVVLDTSAPGEIVTAECGWKVPVTDNKTIIANIADVIIEANSNRPLLRQKGRVARKRILQSYSKTNYQSLIESFYKTAS